MYISHKLKSYGRIRKIIRTQRDGANAVVLQLAWCPGPVQRGDYRNRDLVFQVEKLSYSAAVILNSDAAQRSYCMAVYWALRLAYWTPLINGRRRRDRVFHALSWLGVTVEKLKNHYEE